MMVMYPPMSVLLYRSISQPEINIPTMTPQLADWLSPARDAALA
jgi:hypothetical protein